MPQYPLCGVVGVYSFINVSCSQNCPHIRQIALTIILLKNWHKQILIICVAFKLT